jgi:hypothetical protein
MTTTFAERVQQGVGFAEKLVGEARQVLPQERADQLDASVARAVRRAQRTLERASDTRDGVRMAIKRRPFAATAFAFGMGAMFGVVAAQLANSCRRETASGEPAHDEIDVEC